MAYTKTTWIDKAVQYAKRYYMNWDGGNDKNLFPPFSDWTLHANAVATLPYTLTLTATASSQLSSIIVTVLPSQQYTLKCDRTGTTSVIKTTQLDASGATIGSSGFDTSGTNNVSITTASNAVSLRIDLYGNNAGTFTFTNPQLELGSSATSFAPKKMYTITQSGGTVTAAGTAVNAANLNNIEQGIADAHALAMNMQVLFHMGAV